MQSVDVSSGMQSKEGFSDSGKRLETHGNLSWASTRLSSPCGEQAEDVVVGCGAGISRAGDLGKAKGSITNNVQCHDEACFELPTTAQVCVSQLPPGAGPLRFCRYQPNKLVAPMGRRRLPSIAALNVAKSASGVGPAFSSTPAEFSCKSGLGLGVVQHAGTWTMGDVVMHGPEFVPQRPPQSVVLARLAIATAVALRSVSDNAWPSRR